MPRELSIFVDESGDLGGISAWYLVSLVLHDQNNSIAASIATYEQVLHDRNLPDIPLHAGPLINGHDDYANLDVQQRRVLLASFRDLTQRLPFSYHTFAYRNIQPARYRLFQVADYACTIELTAIKYGGDIQTRSDRMIFGTEHDFRKKHLNRLRKHLIR